MTPSIKSIHNHPLVLLLASKLKTYCKMSEILNGVSVGLAYIVSQGNITATIVWFAITTGVTAGLSYYKEKDSS